MSFDLTQQQIDAQTAKARAGWRHLNPVSDSQHGTPLSGLPAPLIRKDPYRNKWERDYIQHLEMRRYMKEIVAWRYEGLTFRLADNTRLTPDFLVVTAAGFEIHEVKGRHREKWWARFKIAVDMYPWFRWFVCERSRGGTWTMKEVGK